MLKIRALLKLRLRRGAAFHSDALCGKVYAWVEALCAEACTQLNHRRRRFGSLCSAIKLKLMWNTGE